MSGTETLWQELICRLEGVQAAQVVFTENGMPCEIHVLAGPEKSSKSLVRDIQSALTAQFGVQVDHRIISVAQLSEGLAPRGDFRLAHTGLEIKSAGGRVSASVTLARGCDTYTGHGESANTPFARRRCVSEAALAAVNRAAGETCFELASVDAVTLAGQGIVVAQVYSLRDGQRLLGSAFLNEDPDNAAVHSVLSAVNRRLSVLPRTAG
ncbi:MAG: hypothetical protein EGS37_04195 [Ruthenibacterium lactatiformans]|jgi:hypothetical protein|uniref:hypothetical protein n=1 Tax=Ruthenibacterium lactatiformans TaxID=1550024 RepID=UPI0022E384FA|nr:hypothetical protein [Ruthenibacterium lactatiformans]MBD9254846.1 hypothetical protein [Ruthenibacterium lactatiformans]